MTFGRAFWRLAAIIVPIAAGVACVEARAEPPELHLHQSYVEEALRATTLDVKDPMAVFAYVMNSLPERVKVYPTENYFYFTFTHNGSPYAGNIRLDASDRDKGKVQFAYYEQISDWRQEPPGEFRVLDETDGVTLEKVERFLYRLSYRGRSVLFELNDLSQVKPPVDALAPKETFIGPVFDDSGIRFFLVYNAAANNFLYVLDETVRVADELEVALNNERILLGKRTGFVFYQDRRAKRKILVGVYEGNVLINNYLDGPFDQLPDNFIEGETLREAIPKVQPNLKGQIDRFGGTPDGQMRYMIGTYKLYKRIEDFRSVDRCANRRHASEPAYYRCFILDRHPQDLSVRSPMPTRPTNVPKRGGAEPPPAPQ